MPLIKIEDEQGHLALVCLDCWSAKNKDDGKRIKKNWRKTLDNIRAGKFKHKKLTPEQSRNVNKDILKRMSPEQREEIRVLMRELKNVSV